MIAPITLQLAVTSAAVSAFLILALTAAHFFLTLAPAASWRRYGLRLLNTAFAILHVAVLSQRAVPDPFTIDIALVLYASAAGLAVWARVTLANCPPALSVSALSPQRFVVDGPFCLVRHPFYAAYMLAWIAGVIATLSLLLFLVSVWMAACYVLAAQHEEGLYERSAFGDAYRAYRRQTGMLLPRVSAFAPESVVVEGRVRETAP